MGKGSNRGLYVSFAVFRALEKCRQTAERKHRKEEKYLVKNQLIRNRSSWIIAAITLGLACLAGIGRSQQASTTQTQATAGLVAQNEAAQAQTSDKNSDSSDDLRSIIGLQFAPVPLQLGSRDQLLVGLGSYLSQRNSRLQRLSYQSFIRSGSRPFSGPTKADQHGRLFSRRPFLSGR